ncbi:tetratricopeptide repeat protein [Pseudomonas sp. LS1212]|uniref:tetratricopeptide repeat protein n=1 Tax=Pseudomonas sp. LS1212 TaxID=2972478 RepID=UPI00215C4AFB|nr:tetratricopeptide repeat protein [Pseudomonas sp. LS1212]UVJ44301.1 tetratricopeptide repeat protein [Pseudomonas sp. LS1212]
MPRIFISYRREDSQALAGRLFDRLAQRFGKDRVFRDIDAIEAGANFAEVIGERIGGCDVLVALIGTRWLEAEDGEGRRRLDLPHDFVRVEIAAALDQRKLVIPVLIEGTTMPSREVLPEELAPLADRNALPISDARFDFDVGRLIAVIDRTVVAHQPAPGTTTAARRTGLWAHLNEEHTQRTIAFIGAGIAAVVTATWTAYVYFAEKPSLPPSGVSATQGGMATGGDISATAAPGGVAVVATGPVTIGITLDQYEEKIKQRERDLREEYANASRTDKDRIALLEAQLAAVETAARSPEQSLKQYKEILSRASESLAQLSALLPGEELEGARQALARGDTHEAERLFSSVLAGDKQRAAEAAYQLGSLAESRIDYSTAAKYYAEAVTLQPENPQYLDAKGRIAYTLGLYGDAEPLLERVLAIRMKALGPEHPDVATSLNNLAELYVAQGLFTKAEPLHQQALAIRMKALGPEHPDVATSLDNLAELYVAQGLFTKAEPLYQEALAISKKALGPGHPDVAEGLHNLAALYHAQGLYAQAEPLFQQALAINKKARGPAHPDVAKSLNNLALLYDSQGLYAQAEPLFQEALAISKKALGPAHPDVAVSLHNLAALYDAQGLYAQAEPLFQEALAISKKALGPAHPDVAKSLNNLALLYDSQGLYAQAEPLYQEALAISKKALGPAHPDVAVSLNNLAALYYAQGLYAQAEPLYQEALAISKKALGPAHPDVAVSLNNLAALYYAQGLYAKAEPLYQEALAISKKALGPAHPDVATLLENFADLLTKLKREKEAADLRTQANAIRARRANSS